MDAASLFVLLTCLLPTGVTCKKNVFVYSRVGGEVRLQCTNVVSPNCSSISWTFYLGKHVQYTLEVSGGQVNRESNKSNRMSLTSSCSLHLRDLKVEDVGAYMCRQRLAEEAEQETTNVYLSLLAIASPSLITELQPGGDLVLSCIIFTYYDAGSCKSYSSGQFSLSWVSEDGTRLLDDSRYELVSDSRCNVTLIKKLQDDDNNRTWRCRVNTTQSGAQVFLDFTSTFLFQRPSTSRALIPSADPGRPAELPVSRIMLCAGLSVVVLVVCVFTWRRDGKTAKGSANAFDLQRLN